MNAKTFMEFIGAEEGLKSKFVSALQHYRNLTLGQWLNWTEPHNYVSGAFSWGETKEGSEFWSKVCDQWDGVLELSGVLTGENVINSNDMDSLVRYSRFNGKG